MSIEHPDHIVYLNTQVEPTVGHETSKERAHLRSPKSPNPGMINFFSFNSLSIHPVICRNQQRALASTQELLLTTLHLGTLAQKFTRPSGEEIYHRI